MVYKRARYSNYRASRGGFAEVKLLDSFYNDVEYAINSAGKLPGDPLNPDGINFVAEWWDWTGDRQGPGKKISLGMLERGESGSYVTVNQGTNSGDRIGRRIKVLSYHIKAELILTPRVINPTKLDDVYPQGSHSGINPDYRLRMLTFIDNAVNGPTMSANVGQRCATLDIDPLSNTGNQSGILNFRDVYKTSRYTILQDKVVTGKISDWETTDPTQTRGTGVTKYFEFNYSFGKGLIVNYDFDPTGSSAEIGTLQNVIDKNVYTLFHLEQAGTAQIGDPQDGWPIINAMSWITNSRLRFTDA